MPRRVGGIVRTGVPGSLRGFPSDKFEASQPFVIDNAERPNQGPPPSVNWQTDPEGYGANGFTVTSNQFAPTILGNNEMAWTPDVFGPVVDVSIDLPILPGADTRVVQIEVLTIFAVATVTGYVVEYKFSAAGTDLVSILRADNGVVTTQTSTNQDFVAGDTLRMRVGDTTVEAWRKTAGSWTQLLSLNDTTYRSSSFRVGLYTSDSTVRLDGFLATSGTIDVLAAVSQTVSPPVATGSASAPLPGVDVSVPPVVSAANASAPMPIPQLQVPPAAATAAASALLPAAQLKVSPAAATATASAPTPSPQLQVSPPAATASASAPVPVVTAGVTVSPPVATASASAPVPAVGVQVSPGAATASVSALVPAVRLTVLPAAATASASSPTPTVQIGVAPAAATASASAPTPAIQVVILPAAATASASAPTPGTVGNRLQLKVPPPAATASASAPIPTVSGGAAGQTVSPSAATAAASEPTPAIQLVILVPLPAVYPGSGTYPGGTLFPGGEAFAIASAPAPTVTAQGPVDQTVLAPKAIATAVAPLPRVAIPVTSWAIGGAWSSAWGFKPNAPEPSTPLVVHVPPQPAEPLR